MDAKLSWVKWLIIYLVAAAVLVVLSYLAIGWYFGAYPKVPVISDLLSPSLVSPTAAPPPVAGKTAAQKLAVTKTTVKDGGFFYKINGHFLKRPDYQGNILKGDFVIDGDPRQTKIKVLMTAKTGRINMGTFKGSFAGTEIWRLVPTDLLKGEIKDLASVELRLYFASTKADAYNQEVQRVLDLAASGTAAIPDNFALVPSMVGLIEK